jgi:hypothetical protein
MWYYKARSDAFIECAAVKPFPSNVSELRIHLKFSEKVVVILKSNEKKTEKIKLC